MNMTALLCDFAQVSADGKLYVSGAGISRILSVKADPLIVNIALALQVEVDWNETNKMHKLVVELIDDAPDGAQRIDLPLDVPPNVPEEAQGRFYAEFNVGRAPDMQPGEPSLVPLALTLFGMQLPHPGTYFFAVKLDDEDVAQIRFRLMVSVPAMFGGFAR